MSVQWLWWEEAQQLEFSIQKPLVIAICGLLFGMCSVKIRVHQGHMKEDYANSWGKSY